MAQTLEEQQEVISRINEYESVTISQQIDAIPGRENLPQELRDELDNLKQESGIVATEMLSQEQIADMGTADAQRRERVKEIAAMAEDEFALEISFSDNELFQLQNIDRPQQIFLSPAGIPVVLPEGAIPAFYKVRKDPITAYGALASFTIGEGTEKTTYYGHKKGYQFTGYKIAKDSTAYEFGALPRGRPIRARIIDKGLVPNCSHLYYEGDYYTTNINDTGTGPLVTNLSFTGNLDLLTIDEQGYSACLPDIDYERFTDYLVGIYNYFGQGGFIRKIFANDGTTAYLYSVLDNEGVLRHYQYNTGNGLWQFVEVPVYDVDTAGALNYLFGEVFSSAAGHLVLDMAGMAPIAGEVFDVLNGVWYTIEGDGKNAMISFASTIPLVYATAVKNVGRVVKMADGSHQVLKISSQQSEAFIDQLKRLNLDDDALRRFNQDLDDVAFAGAISENPELINVWNGLVNRPDWVRKNTRLLEKISGESDEFISKVDNFYSNFHSATGFKGAGRYGSVDYDEFGFPDFTPHISDKSHVVKIVMDGSNEDYLKAYEKLKDVIREGNIQFTNNFGSSFKIKKNGEWSETYTWHHHEDGKSMVPVLQNMHNSHAHTGGRSVVNSERNIKGLFEGPKL